MPEKSYGELVLDRVEQIDREYMETQRAMQITTDEGTKRLRPEDFDAYKAWFLGKYPPRLLKMPDGTIVFESPAVMVLRDYPELIVNRDEVWLEIKKALGVE